MKTPEHARVTKGHLASTVEYGNNGCFEVQFEGYKLQIIASDGQGWEHVSVSLPNRTPNWKEMCFVKDLFWDAEDCVVQFHPPKSQYVNNHATCLHLWKPVGKQIETPPSILVGLI